MSTAHARAKQGGTQKGGQPIRTNHPRQVSTSSPQLIPSPSDNANAGSVPLKRKNTMDVYLKKCLPTIDTYRPEDETFTFLDDLKVLTYISESEKKTTEDKKQPYLAMVETKDARFPLPCSCDKACRPCPAIKLFC